MLSLNEVHFGAPLPRQPRLLSTSSVLSDYSWCLLAGMCHITRCKTRPHVFHKIAVEGRRYMSAQALEAE